MDELNGEGAPLSGGKIDKGGAQAKDEASSELPIQLIMPIFLFAAIEVEFVMQLVHLIRSHAQLWYVSSAAIVQLTLVMAAVTYRKIWRILRSTESSTLGMNSILARIGYMVMCLLLALMFYSHYAALAAKAP
jgi:hypothetical protein